MGFFPLCIISLCSERYRKMMMDHCFDMSLQRYWTVDFRIFENFKKILKNEHFTEKIDFFKYFFSCFGSKMVNFYFFFKMNKTAVICTLIAFYSRFKRKNQTMYMAEPQNLRFRQFQAFFGLEGKKSNKNKK